MTHINSYGTLTYTRITESQPEDQTLMNKKRIWKIVDLAVSADCRRKLRECEKKDKYLDLSRELKKLWNMKVTIVPIVIGVLAQ